MRYSGVYPRVYVIMAYTNSENDVLAAGRVHRFFVPKMLKHRIMSKKIKTSKVASLSNEIQMDKQFVENLMRRIARIRLELKNHFEKSKLPEGSQVLDEFIESSDNNLFDAYCMLNGIHATLIEMEVRRG